MATRAPLGNIIVPEGPRHRPLAPMLLLEGSFPTTLSKNFPGKGLLALSRGLEVQESRSAPAHAPHERTQKSKCVCTITDDASSTKVRPQGTRVCRFLRLTGSELNTLFHPFCF